MLLILNEFIINSLYFSYEKTCLRLRGAGTQMVNVGKFEIIKDLIITEFSDIYLCRDNDLGVSVAIKVFHPKGENAGPERKSRYSAENWRERFIEEARLLARLDHPHIISVRALDYTEDGKPYMVMPFIEANLIYEIGRDAADAEKIDEKWRPKRVSVERAIFLLRQLLSALAELHRRKIFHRDLKPGNILLTAKQGGSVKLCDFGTAKLPDWTKSRSGIWIGTLDYMAPEQRKSAAEIDARADVFAVAVLAYRMLTKQLPAGAFPPPNELSPYIPASLNDWIMRGMSQERSKRPLDASEMLKLLNELI
jgi:serine/threonine-protein kinase